MTNRLIAFRLQPPQLTLMRSPIERDWMSNTRDRFAYRCLPLLLANQSGWVVLNAGRVTVTWNGGSDPVDCHVESKGCPDPPLSHFGSGIVTWRIPFLFRTPAGWNLLMRGPVNHPKDGASSLEGIIETDWAVQPAFHSWKVTRLSHPVTWEDGEPICLIVPQRRGELETWDPVIHDVSDDRPLLDQYAAFSRSRTEFNHMRPAAWQKHYFLGTSPGGASAPARAHQTKLSLREFEESDEAIDSPNPSRVFVPAQPG